MYPCPLSWLAIGRVFVYYARAAHAFSAGIKCWHCSYFGDGLECLGHSGRPTADHEMVKTDFRLFGSHETAGYCSKFYRLHFPADLNENR